jgi:transcriptional regulator with XRE-family HTH domain/DNA-directed RNA polymerase subunit RPC12/RpoP
MDQIKIGKFIAERRKQNNLTQMQLAEKLNITDRAISKWENGKGMPDSSLMLELCDYLKISVNELLNGEMIEMKEYDKRAEELLLEMARVDEQQNKRLMTSMWTMIITSVIFYIGILSLSVSLLTEGPILGAIICASTAVFVIAAFIALKFEVEAGYYECKKCHHKFVPTYMQALMAMHMSTTRYLKCPECHKRSWAKKVMYK